MRWRKLGKIFDPAEHPQPADCIGWAQSPQPVVFDDHIRIFYSTRARDEVGKYISHVSYVDMSKDLRQVLAVAEKPVIEQGGLGCFDEHGIFPMNVIRNGDALWGYTCGWSRRASVSVETAIGLAISYDGGTSFERTGAGPILGPSALEPFLVGDAYVRNIDGLFHMWYIFGTDWRRLGSDGAAGREPDRTYKIGHATSTDGVVWSKEEGRRIVADVLGEDECQALPSVVTVDGRHHMVFCYRESLDFRTNASRGYRIGHAFSDDLQNWIRDDATPALDPTPGAWDSDMLCYPNVFECDGEVYVLYNGNEFGRHGFGAAVLER
jgi:hypothetical protein